MTAPAEYRIATIADFLAVPADKQAECLRDFEMWLELARQSTAVSQEISQALGGKINFQTAYFTWIDDGVAGCSAFDLYEEGGDRMARISVEGGAG